ncbi:hypothetical protein pdam_00014581 [Pocillopora damicornis]|uniref:ubiquitinyl hydrolase 1 n=1 Tax=Pocillopora damicornis TaxID=46731 RepID=A0A3M6UHJ5_POCDA|nr:hypothetical protein pdam_00014581 [Pocillopora damicornis]
MARRTTNRKQQGTVLKQAWEWADYTEPENVISDNVESAYRINTAACSPGNCRRNCKANPNCFNCLGERFWLSEIKDSYWLNCEDPENERRPENAFVGLKNLGATCYVNTFLQVWFHNPVFRSAMYKYISPTSRRPEQEVKSAVNGLSTSEALSSSPNHSEVTNHSSHNGETSNKPAKDSSKLNHHSSENGGSLDKPLNVPTTPSKVSAVEQVPLLPSTTILNSDEAPTTVCGHLQLLFAQLQYSFRRYIDPSPFVDSLGLDTAQQQDAQEFSKLFTSLLEETFSKQAEPEVQNIVQSQFGGEYFYVTEKTGYKKKLNSFIQFPDNLDMTEHVKSGGSGSNHEYELSAVLMHFGVSAYSGHYVAHIRDKKSGSWYKFNDEDIVKMQGKLKLSQDEDSTDTSPKPAKRPKCAQGFHVSKNAYTLVYTLKGHKGVGSEDDDVEVPPHVLELVAMDNSLFEHWVTQVKTFRQKLIAKGQESQAEIRRLYLEIPVSSGKDYEWISTKWLKDWMNEKTVTPPVDNSSLLCSHGKLDPNQALNAKRINIKAADEIFRNYGGLPRLQSDSLCIKCVQEQCRRIRFETRLSEDYKFVSDTLKSQQSNSANYFWVGRRSLLRWKVLANYQEEARQSLMDSCRVTANHETEDDDEDKARQHENNDMTMTEEAGKPQTLDGDLQDPGEQEEEDEGNSEFNEDLLCEHGSVRCLCSIKRFYRSMEAVLKNMSSPEHVNITCIPHQSSLYLQSPPDSKKQKLNRDPKARRSSRHRKQRGEVSLTVGSSETLRDVKVQLMKSFSVMPMDQHLTLNGIPLTDNAATLRSLGIRPGSLLLLKIDEPQGAISQEALPVNNAPEEGFKGTGLLGNS